MAKGFRNPSVMRHDFSVVPGVQVPRSNFRRSRSVKTAFDSGYLVPFFVDEVLPGDSYSVRLSTVARLITPIVPIMDNIQLDFFFFYAPNRILWEHWRDFMGEHDEAGPQDTDYTVPIVAAPGGGWANETLFDYFGVPTQEDGVEINALHSRCYNRVWNEWFRDQNLQNRAVVDVDDGPDTESDYVLLKRGKRHDYFTSCLPWPQKGTAVSLPLGTECPVIGDGTTMGLVDTPNSGGYVYGLRESGGYLTGDSAYDRIAVGSTPSAGVAIGNNKGVGLYEGTDGSGVIADLSTATAATINEIREAFQLQRMMEKDARSGSRYTEIIKGHFGVVHPDQSWRTEYLGGGSTNVVIEPVAQTSETNTTEQGTLAAIGYQNHSGIGFHKSFTEHGVLLGLCCCRCDLTYQQGLDRMWSRQTKYDYYWPGLSMLGEQEVLNKEIYWSNSSVDDDAFGYLPRYDEYRYAKSMITGKLRSNDANSLDAWHLSQEFGSLPTLAPTFIEETPPIDRITAVSSEPELKMDAFVDVLCTRCMPAYAVPGMIDHF